MGYHILKPRSGEVKSQAHLTLIQSNPLINSSSNTMASVHRIFIRSFSSTRVSSAKVCIPTLERNHNKIPELPHVQVGYGKTHSTLLNDKLYN